MTVHASRELLRKVARQIQEAQRPLRILRALEWTPGVEKEFFERRARELPQPVYAEQLDTAKVKEQFHALVRRFRGKSELERYLRGVCASYITAAEMVEGRGTTQFYERSCRLYGAPSSVSCDGKTTNLALAEHFDACTELYASQALLGDPREEATLGAEEAAIELGRRFGGFFTQHPIRVEVTSDIAANAVASADLVRLKRGVRFTERDLLQLEYHEGHVHVLTTLNGRMQPVLSFLGNGGPRTTNTQEGLATFTEFVTHTIDLERVRRLTDRILAIRMSEQGADFLDLYRFFLERGHTERQAFDCARRVVRGGLVTGGAPFTKDVCYLDGLLKVSRFVRHALIHGRPELVRLLFVGKLELDDVPLLARLYREGLVAMPHYLPAWAKDLGFLTAYMSYSAFSGRTDAVAEHRYFESLIGRAEAELPPLSAEHTS